MIRSRIVPRTALTTSLAALALAAPPLHAQQVPSPYEFVERKQDIGPFAAWLFTDRGNAELGPRSGPMFGLQYGLRVSDPLQLSAMFAYMDAEMDVVDPGAEGGPAPIGRENFTLMMIAGRMQLNLTGARTWNNLMPYVTAGAGIAFDATAAPSCGADATSPLCDLEARERFDFNNSFVAQFGLGVAWLPTERLGLRLTAHDNIWRIESPPAFLEEGLPPEAVPPATEWLNNIQLTAGLHLWF